MKLAIILSFIAAFAVQAGDIIYVDPVAGDDDNTGESTTVPKRTLHGAMLNASAGKTIRLRGGVYRYPGQNPNDTVVGNATERNCAQATDYPGYNRVVAKIAVSGTPGAPITIEPNPGEKPILKGSVRVSSWIPATVDDGISSQQVGKIWKRINWQTPDGGGELFKPYGSFTPGSPGATNFTADPMVDGNNLSAPAAHYLSVGSVVQVESTDTLPGGLKKDETYFVSTVGPAGQPIESRTKFTLSKAQGGTTIPITSQGSGLHVMRSWDSRNTNPQQVFVSDSELVDGVCLTQINWPRLPSGPQVAWENGYMPFLAPPYPSTQYEQLYGGVNGRIEDMVRGSFFYKEEFKSGNDESTIYVWLPHDENPNKKVVEVSTSTSVLVCGDSAGEGNYVHVKGISFRHSNGFAINHGHFPILHLRDNVTVEDCDVQWADMSGIVVGANAKLLRCNISNNGNQGFTAGLNSIVDGCLIAGNNYRNFSAGYHCGGTKIIGINPQAKHGLIIQNCEFFNNHGPSIWFDTMDARTADAPYTIIRHNYFHDNKPILKTRNGFPGGYLDDQATISLEISAKFRVHGNIFLRNSRRDIIVDSSEDVEIYDNLFLGASTNGTPGGQDFAPSVDMWAGARYEPERDSSGNPVEPQNLVLRKLKNVHFRRNVIANTRDTGLFGVHMYSMYKNGVVAEGNTSDYNFYSQGGQLLRFGGNNQLLFGAWKTFSEFDANSSISNPKERISELLDTFVEADPVGSNLGASALLGAGMYGVEVGQYPFQKLEFKPQAAGWYRLIRGTQHSMAGNVEIAYRKLTTTDNMTARFQFDFASYSGKRNLVQESFSAANAGDPIIDRVVMAGYVMGEIFVHVTKVADDPIYITFTTPTAGALLLQPPQYQSGTATITPVDGDPTRMKVKTTGVHDFSYKSGGTYISAVYLFGFLDSRMDGGYRPMSSFSPIDNAADEFLVPLPAGMAAPTSATCAYFHDGANNVAGAPAIGSVDQFEKTLVFSTNGIKSLQGFGYLTGTNPINSVYPEFVGQNFYNTTTGEVWIATGLNATDWQAMTRNGEPAEFPSVELGSGTVGAPSINFGGNGDSDTGIFQPNVSSIGIAIDGSLVAKYDASGLEVIGGNDDAPGYSFRGDDTTGMFQVSSGKIGFATSGLEQVRIDSNGLRTFGSLEVNPDLAAVGYPSTRTLILSRQSTTSTAVELTKDGAAPSGTNRIEMEPGKTYAITATIVARSASGSSAMYVRNFCVENHGGTTSLVNAISEPVTKEDNSNCDVNIGVLNNASGADYLKIDGVGLTSTVYNWSCRLEITEVSAP